jgi:hypothetical protein
MCDERPAPIERRHMRPRSRIDGHGSATCSSVMPNPTTAPRPHQSGKHYRPGRDLIARDGAWHSARIVLTRRRAGSHRSQAVHGAYPPRWVSNERRGEPRPPALPVSAWPPCAVEVSFDVSSALHPQLAPAEVFVVKIVHDCVSCLEKLVERFDLSHWELGVRDAEGVDVTAEKAFAAVRACPDLWCRLPPQEDQDVASRWTMRGRTT